MNADAKIIQVMRSVSWMIMTELRLRARRLSSLVTLLVAAALAWSIFPDPQSGHTFIVIGGAQVRNTSTAIALGSACMFSMLFGLAGFYLTRGRSAADLRDGVASVIGASPVHNSLLLACRWIGNAAYLVAMCGGYLLAVLVCHVLRGVGPVELHVYWQIYVMFLLPVICFTVSSALLFDSLPVLMGKFGDVLYFVIWTVQFSLVVAHDDHGSLQWTGLDLIDFSGLAVAVKILHAMVHTDAIAFGMADFDPKLAALTLPYALIPSQALLLRLTTAALSLPITVPAVALFHRYTGDRVKPGHAAQRRTPLQLLNQWARPLTVVLQPLYELAARTGGLCGRVLADVALTLNGAPVTLLLVPVLLACAMLVHYPVLPGLLMGAVVCWGVVICDVPTRDHSSDCASLTGVLAGGVPGRFVRQFLTVWLPGVLFCAPIAVRLAFQDFILAVALMVGLASLSALASMFGLLARTPRLFLALFLFWVYVATQAATVPVLDVVGFNGVADGITVLVQCGIGVAAFAIGYVANRWR